MLSKIILKGVQSVDCLFTDIFIMHIELYSTAATKDLLGQRLFF